METGWRDIAKGATIGLIILVAATAFICLILFGGAITGRYAAQTRAMYGEAETRGCADGCQCESEGGG